MAAPKQGGFKMSLGGLKAKAGLKASILQKDAKRPRLALGDDGPDDSIKQQEIVGWDAAEGGALDVGGKKEVEGPRIIPALPDRDFRAEARRKQLTKAPHQQVQQVQNVENTEVEEATPQYGLRILKKDDTQEVGAEETTVPESTEVEKDNLTEEQRLEKNALDALLNDKSAENQRVIAAQTEEEALLDEIHNAPDAPSLEAYEATPVDGFGAALLRGMGWKDGDANSNNSSTTKPKEVKRRPALLGIGAKEEAAAGIEIGDWGNKNKSKGKKIAQVYNPVTLRNKHTGELISEEELKAKLESQELVEDRPQKERRTKYDGEEDDDWRREKRRDRKNTSNQERERRRDDGYDGGRKKDNDRKSDRRRDKDDYYDSDRRRDKLRDDEHDSERRKDQRKDEYDSDRRKDKRRDREGRDRSRSPNGERKEKRHDRYRSRSRDNEDRRDRGKDRERRQRSRSPESESQRKRRRERGYDDDRDDRDNRRKRYKDEKSYR